MDVDSVPLTTSYLIHKNLRGMGGARSIDVNQKCSFLWNK